jgi:serine/threonine protein kinase
MVPGFSLNIPAAGLVTPAVLVETKDEREVERRIFIGADDTMISPVITTHAPTFAIPPHILTATSSSSSAADKIVAHAPGATAAASSKFYHISNSNMYVFVEGAALFPDERSADSTVRMSDDQCGPLTPFSHSDGEALGSLKKQPLDSGGSREEQRKSHTGRKDLTGSDEDFESTNGDTYDMDRMVIGATVGSGQQGCVQHVTIDGKPFALKRVNITDAAKSDNDVERQGRKSGIVRELNMIRDQRCKKSSEYVVRLHNACVRRFQEKQELQILMELLSSSVEDLQKAASRIPFTEMTSIMQRSFKSHLTGQQLATPKEKLMGSFEFISDRQTAFPEIFLSLLANDLLHGLDHLHTVHRYVHCDLKLANILLGLNQFGFKIADFGCSSQVGEDGFVSRLGSGLGSKLYMAPERIPDDGIENSPVRFSTKSDIWSVGILLLELAAGCHPCEPFKSDFWNFKRLLSPEHLVAPISWTNEFQDFIIKCLRVDDALRPSARALLDHAFIRRYAKVPRASLKRFVADLRTSSTTYQKKLQRESLKQHLTIATKTNDQHRHKHLSKKVWTSFTGFLSHPPETNDTEKFPALC